MLKICEALCSNRLWCDEIVVACPVYVRQKARWLDTRPAQTQDWRQHLLGQRLLLQQRRR